MKFSRYATYIGQMLEQQKNIQSANRLPDRPDNMT